MTETILLVVFGIALAIVLIGFFLKVFNQPHVVTYIIAGIILGPSVIGLVKDYDFMASIGTIGVVLLMFFVGSEISFPRIVSNWKIAIIGPILQVIIASGVMLAFGGFQGWDAGKSVLIAFVITLSSTAVIVKILKDWKELHTKIGQDVVGILIVQDILVVPMLLALNFFGTGSIDAFSTARTLLAGVFVVLFIIYLVRHENINIPYVEKIKKDPELFVFFSLIICFGFAAITSYFGLSGALGAFVAGIIVGNGNRYFSIKRTLEPFYFFFVAIFFISIGMLFDVNFVIANHAQLIFLVLIVFTLSTVMNMFVMKLLGSSWKESFYAGSLLAQLGEFGFVLAAAGLGTSIITGEDHALVIALISLTLILSPFWVKFVKLVMRIKKGGLKVQKDMTRAMLDGIYCKNAGFMRGIYCALRKRTRRKK